MTDPVVTSIANPPPAKKPRKPRASKQPAAAKVERKPRTVTTPARTLRRRIDDLGPYHLEAFDRQRKKGGEAYEVSVREALNNADALRGVDERLVNAQNELTWAKEAQARMTSLAASTQPVLDRLALAAKILAGLDDGDVEAGTPVTDFPPDGL